MHTHFEALPRIPALSRVVPTVSCLKTERVAAAEGRGGRDEGLTAERRSPRSFVCHGHASHRHAFRWLPLWEHQRTADLESSRPPSSQTLLAGQQPRHAPTTRCPAVSRARRPCTVARPDVS